MNIRIFSRRASTVLLMMLGSLLAAGETRPVHSSEAPISEANGLTYFFETKKRSAADAQPGDWLGLAVDISGDTLVVGASREDGGPGDPLPESGAVYVYERDADGVNNWGQAVKLTASDAQTGDNFGLSVAIDGDTIAVGAFLEDGGPGDPLTDSGAVYIFERDLGGPGNWGQAVRISAGDAQPGDHFGVSIALDADFLAVGASTEDGGGGDPLTDSGAVYVFERDLGGAGVWGQAVKLAAGDAQDGDYFGSSVAFSGDTVVAGAMFEDGGPGDPLPDTGAAYVFESASEGAGGWSEITKLAAGDAQVGDWFGVSVSVHLDTIVVGAFREDGSAPNPEAGAAYVFERDSGGADNWGETRKLTAHNPESGDYFGNWTAVQGDTVVVGAYFASGETGFPGAGAVYVFERELGGSENWGQRAMLTAGDPDFEDHFGISVALDGDTLGVGAFRDDGELSNSDLGAAYVFRRLSAKALIPAVSACMDLYRDDFSNPNSGWPVGDDGNILLGYLNGEYRVRILDPFWSVVVRPGPSFTDFLLSADVRSVNTNAGTFGLVFGLNSGFTEMYTFEIDSEKGYELWRYEGTWVLLDAGISNALLSGLSTNNLAVERNGSSIRLFANGVLISSTTDTGITGLGQIGVIVSNADEGALDIRFDDFHVLPIGCGLSAGAAVSAPGAWMSEGGAAGYISGQQGRR